MNKIVPVFWSSIKNRKGRSTNMLKSFGSMPLIPPRFPAFASDGSRFGSLFNKFTVMSNAQWRRKLESSK
jgi:hypothetical protein